MTKYQCWGSDYELTISTVEGCADMLSRDLLGPNPELLYELEAESWEEAMSEHHRRQGWAPYVPMTFNEKTNDTETP